MTPSGNVQDASNRQQKTAVGRTPRRRWRMLVVVSGSVVVAALGGFLAVLLLSDRRQEASEPAGVQSYENLSRTHTYDPVTYEQSPPVGGDQPRLAERRLLRGTRTQRESRAHHGAWCCVDHLRPRPASGSEGQAEAACREPGLSASEPLPRLAGPVVASGWGKQLQLGSVDDPGLREFIRAYRKGPQTPEPGASCTGATEMNAPPKDSDR